MMKVTSHDNYKQQRKLVDEAIKYRHELDDQLADESFKFPCESFDGICSVLNDYISELKSDNLLEAALEMEKILDRVKERGDDWD